MLGDRKLIRLQFDVVSTDIPDRVALSRRERYRVYKGVKLPKYAIRDYMTTCKDVALLEHVGVGRAAVASAMLEATYSNMITESQHLVTKPRVDRPNDNNLAIYKCKKATWNNWRRFSPLGVVIHILIPGMSVGQVRTLGMS